MSWIPHIGTEFAGYRLDSLLGHGGMSIVYQAEHIMLERKVALKLLSPQLGEDEAFRERFMRESRLAASLDHPNIIPIYEAAESEGVFFIAMRYVDGSDLRALLKQGPLESQRLISIVDQTANALAAAHARGLIHRDVKPANILVDPGEARGEADHVYLSDFGVAKQVAAPGLTKTGVFVGTAEYSAPEQIEGTDLDARADVYSLGCVVYECLTGTTAYDKDSEVALMYAHLLEPPPSVSERRPDLPAELDEVVGKAMAKSRDDRYPGPKELAGALRDALAGVPASAVHPTASAPATMLASAAATEAGAAATQAGADAPATEAGPGAAAAAATTAGEPAARADHPSDASAATATPPARSGLRRRPALIATGLATAAAIGLAVALIIVATGGGGGSSDKAAGTGTTGTGTGSTPAGTAAAGNLLSVLAPTEIAHSCKTLDVPTQNAVETDICEPPPSAPTDYPDELRLDFYPNAQLLEKGYERAEQGLKAARCGTILGEREWFHPTGKQGGRRECFLDAKGRFVIVWTHEKLGSEDHVDMVGIAKEPGRDPTTFKSWWSAVNDAIGKCRPKASTEACLATIQKLVPKS
ncbi:MAG: serine/threonine-protein kinase [Verrucomicrobiota bacterium]